MSILEFTGVRAGRMAKIASTLALLFLIVFAGNAAAALQPADPAPAISSDKADYGPGELVALSGSGWTPGETVHIYVNDDTGSTWSRDVDVTADAFGGVADRFNLPDWFVARYSVKATAASGAVATSSFTDGTVKAKASSAGSTFTLTATKYTSTDCTSGAGTPTTVSAVDSSTGANVPGLGSSESVKLQAAATSDQGRAFTNCSSGDSFTDLGGRAICVRGFATGTHDFLANFAADSTPPVITPTVTGTLGSNGWYVSNVTVSWAVTDAQSTISSQTGCATTTITTDQAATTYTCSATSGGGTSSNSVSVKRDATNPIVTTALARAADHNGWYNHAVGYSASATDATSGVASCQADDTYSGPDDGAASVSRSCTDNAGNTASDSQSLEYDATSPTSVSGAPARAADSNGWYNHAVTIQFAGQDATSGIDTCSSPTYSGPDGTGLSVNGSCTDTAGNTSADVASDTFKYDATKPTLDPSVTPNPVVLNASATASAGASDATSGVGTSSCTAVSTSSVGPHSVTCTATDTAGNQASAVASYGVIYAVGASCMGSPGHEILAPIKANWQTDLSVFKSGSTVPAKFRVCDANGVSIAAADVIAKFALTQKISLAASEAVDELVYSTTPDTAFRWSASDQLWIFNIATKSLKAGTTYVYQVTLNDGSTVDFRFGLK